MTDLIPILLHTQSSYAEAIFSALSKGKRHAKLLYSEWYKTYQALGKNPAFINAERLLADICFQSDFSFPLELVRSGTKFLTRTHDALDVESVMIPMASGGTLCVSSQVGCRMGCAFCETGKMGLLRSLTVEEIVAQAVIARHILKFDFKNIVFMGMGEPLDNMDAVEQALRVLMDPAGMAIAGKHISVSTSGRVDEMERFLDPNFPKVNLAVSVNAPNDAVRNKLMPVNRKHDMSALYDVMQRYCAFSAKKIFVEYVLIEGKTDALEHADELACYLQGLDVKVNLIPYNPQSKGIFKAPTEEALQAFAQRMKEHGYYVLIRYSKGQREMAACGQLGNLQLRKLRKKIS